jgi:hypothetical protein
VPRPLACLRRRSCRSERTHGTRAAWPSRAVVSQHTLVATPPMMIVSILASGGSPRERAREGAEPGLVQNEVLLIEHERLSS